MSKFYDRNPNQKDDYVSDESEYYIHSENTNTSKTVLNEDNSNPNIGKTISNEENNNTNPYDWRGKVKNYDGLAKVVKVVMVFLFVSMIIVFVIKYRIREMNKQENNIVQQVANIPNKETREVVVDTTLRDKLARLGGSMSYTLDENKKSKEFWEPDRTSTYQSIGDSIYTDNMGRVYILSGALSNIRKCKIGILQGWICTITYNGESRDMFVNKYYHYNSNDENQSKESYLNVSDTVNIYNDYNLVLTQEYYDEYYRKRAKEIAKVESREYKEKFDKKNYSEDLLTEQELLDLYMTCDWCHYEGTLWEMSDDIETVSITFDEMKKLNTETGEWIKSLTGEWIKPLVK